VERDEPLNEVEDALREHFGSEPVRASVSFLGVEPLDVLRFEPIPDERAYVTLGLSRHPMTEAAQAVRAAHGPRAELALHLRDPTDAYADVWRALAVLAAAPAVEGVVYRRGMTVDLGSPLAPGVHCSGGIIADSVISSVAAATGVVDFLRVIPITRDELAWCRVRGSGALLDRWQECGTDLLDLARRSVELD
jgi:hypothetical protein